VEEQGTRFSLVYLSRGAPACDSQRFRNRLAAYYWQHLHETGAGGILQTLQKEAGIEIPYILNFGHSISDLFKKGELRDVLDSITLMYQFLMGTRWKADAAAWKSFVRRTLREENVGYSVDDQGGVHYFADEEFERNRESTVAVLDHPRYTGVRAAFDDAYRHMDSDPRDTKASVRSIFESLEILVKLMVETRNLNKWILENTLKEKCLVLYNADPVGKKVTAELFDSMGRWVDAGHNYRHGQTADEPVAPDEQLAVHILSTGSSYLRWLTQMDRQLNLPAPELRQAAGARR
jgi:hypothetical protein